MSWLAVWVTLLLAASAACGSNDESNAAPPVGSTSQPRVASPNPRLEISALPAPDPLEQEARALQMRLEAQRAHAAGEPDKHREQTPAELAEAKAQASAELAEQKKSAAADLAIQREQAAQAARIARVIDAARVLLRSTSPSAKLTATGAAIVIDAPADQCDGRILARLRARLKANNADPSIVFDEMNCGEMGDAIDLRTKNGCPPNQTDELILTDAGARRRKFADGISETIGLQMNLMISAMGCDGTVLSLMSFQGQSDACNENTLTEVAAASPFLFTKFGFTRMMCGPDGPSISMH
ncbi:MAG: hypothetical protein ABIY55_08485 [Kofleriaceae bacterium]